MCDVKTVHSTEGTTTNNNLVLWWNEGGENTILRSSSFMATAITRGKFLNRVVLI